MEKNVDEAKLVEVFRIDDDPKIKIKHLVLAGGGVCGFSTYGALRESHKSGFWDINNIESIYSTSVGAIFATILSLKYEWSVIDDYLIKRPWQHLFKFNMYSIINSFQNMGIFDILKRINNRIHVEFKQMLPWTFY